MHYQSKEQVRMKYKKVLFLDTTLHKNGATGITLSNLFGSWEKENLYMIGPTEIAQLSATEEYKNIYILSEKDYYHRFPLGLFLKVLRGMKRIINSFAANGTTAPNLTNNSENSPAVKKNLFKTRFSGLFRYLGFDHLFFRQIISKDLREWIKKSNPDIFYAVLSTRHSILFAHEIVKEFNKPLIVHIMDDWPSTIGNDCLFAKYWNKTINQELKNLLNTTYRKIAISRVMANEYETRFGVTWVSFHNPVSLEKWLPYQKHVIKRDSTELINFAYFGRIGRANEDAILKFINAIIELESSYGIRIRIDFFTSQCLLDAYCNSKVVRVIGFIDHSKIPETISQYDFLLLPLSFKAHDVQFSRLSIPTKLSEYLISGVPVVVLAPEATALSDFVKTNNAAFVINTDHIPEISHALNRFISDIELQVEISQNAKAVAVENFSMEKVTYNLNELFKFE